MFVKVIHFPSGCCKANFGPNEGKFSHVTDVYPSVSALLDALAEAIWQGNFPKVETSIKVVSIG